MSDIEARMGILEHRMDNNEEQNRRLEDELVRSRMEVRDAFQRLDLRMDETNHRIYETNRRIDETNQRMDQRFDQLSQQILELAAQTNRLHRWILAVALFLVTVLPITFTLADRWL